MDNMADAFMALWIIKIISSQFAIIGRYYSNMGKWNSTKTPALTSNDVDPINGLANIEENPDANQHLCQLHTP